MGPEKGGIALASIVAKFLSSLHNKTVYAAYAEKRAGGGFSIGRGFSIRLKDSTTLIVEDIAVSGTTIRDTMAAVTAVGGFPMRAIAICSRGQINLGEVPFWSLCRISGMARWPEEECPICLDSNRGPNTVRLDVNSHGSEFLKRLKAK